ncbi:MAG: hypothetical protein ACPLW6_04100 [Desulfurella sp.]|uniref:hypothetical protein n=1 Tax=Desulfurella sp. TaxID=1962857 RepID=UPI003C78BDFF
MKKDTLDYEALLPEVDERLKNSCSKEQEQLFYNNLKEAGFTRRDFLKWTSMITAALTLPPIFEPRVAKAVAAIAPRPTVIWLHFAECTGCTESFLRTINPSIEQVIFDTVNLAFHDTLMMASGKKS